MGSENPTELHSRTSLLSNFILGSQDGVVNVLGILLGLTAATNDVRLIFVAAFAALGAESISMGAVAYTSTLARRKQYLKEVSREETEMREIPEAERKEVRDIFQKWEYQGEELERLTDLIASKPRAWLEFMMSHELQLESVGESEPRRNFLIVLSSAVFGSLIPIVPYFLVGNDVLLGAIGAVSVSGVVLFVIGFYEARTTVGSLWRSGLQMAIIGLAAGLAGFLIGHFIGASPA
ncbi:MAG TPA: VIT1/CCC1 transporter family protein [Nitrososphaerales archaeon]|nr:VIT1/CCC1 transporter family protein [Nitrososphaerales archaeon]